MASPTTRVIPSFDPFSIKEQLITLAEDYFNLDNIDMYESGFMGYLVQALTTTTSDMLYQNAFAYNEAFLGRALLKSSITNIANELDYKIKAATPASGSLTLYVPITLEVETSIKIAAGSSVRAGSIPYKVYNTYYIRQNTGGQPHITSYNADTGLVEEIPYSIELSEGNTCVVFDIDIWQVAIYEYDFTFSNPTLYNFYSESITGYEGYLYDTVITVDGEKYTQVDSLYGSTDSDRHYELKFVNGSDNDTAKMTVKFGNGIYGFQPKNGAEGLITLYTTLGKAGNIAKEEASLDENLVDTINAGQGNLSGVSSLNQLAITNGEDEESLEEIRQHTKENVSAAKRLVTETDYTGYPGVTGLTNIVAYPLLDRRNLNGNEITIYNALFDEDGYPIPTASIYTEFGVSKNTISKGEEIEWIDGITYVSPFELTYYNAYDVPYAKYTYSLSSTEVAPVLFYDNTPDDVEMSLTSYQVKFYPNEGHVAHIIEVYKLATMDNSCISAKLYFGDELYDLQFSTTYQNNTVINMSTSYVDYDDYPAGNIDWKVELYYTYPESTEPVLYNTYYGTIDLLENGILVDTEQDIYLEPSSPDNYFTAPSANYKMTSSDSDKGAFLLPVLVTSAIEQDDDGNDLISYKNISVICHFNDNDYNMQIYSVLNESRIYTYTTSYFSLDSVDVGYYDVSFDVTYTDNDGDEVYTNTYIGKIEIFAEGKTMIKELTTVAPERADTPQIEMVHIGLTSIDIDMVETTTGDDAYVFTLMLSKFHTNSASKISVLMTMESDSYNFNEGDSYTMEYGGELKIAETDDEISNATVVIFTSPQIASSELPSGEVGFKIEIRYDNETIAIYKQYVTFKQDISRIMKSDIITLGNDETTTYACSVPVIEKSYYEDNLRYLDSAILSKFQSLSDTFNQWGMLTDFMNMKFVRTCGTASNMVLNNKMDSTVKLYDSDFSVKLPIPVHVEVYVSKDTNSNTSALEAEARNIIYTFLTLKSGFHANIYRSEILRYLHDAMPDILYAHVLEPTDEIIYDFDISKISQINQETLFTYCPEYIWFDKDNITVDIILM